MCDASSVLSVTPDGAYRIAGNFGRELNMELNMAVWRSVITIAKLKSAKMSYSHIYVWRSRTELPNLNPPIFFDLRPNCQI